MSGVARKMDRTGLKSDYCTTKATAAFEDLIENSRCRYILFSRCCAKVKVVRIAKKKEVLIFVGQPCGVFLTKLSFNSVKFGERQIEDILKDAAQDISILIWRMSVASSLESGSLKRERTTQGHSIFDKLLFFRYRLNFT